MAELDADRALVLTYVPVARRRAVEALWRLDLALGHVLAGGREPLISQIKLAWWRDALEKLDRNKPPAEPVLEAIAAHLLPLGVTGAQLSELEQGWAALVSPDPLTRDELASYAANRGSLLFRLTGAALGRDISSEIERAGRIWALVDLARHSNEVDARAAVGAARELMNDAQRMRWPSRLRPIGMLAALARRDLARGEGPFEQHGAPGRMLRMLGHRLTGL